MGFFSLFGQFRKKYGPELIVAAADRDFNINTGFWTLSAGVTMAAGVVSFNTPTAYALYKLNVLAIGMKYEYTFTILNITSGGLRAACGSTGAGTLRTAPGIYTEVVTATTATIGIMANGASTVADIDNVSFRRKY